MKYIINRQIFILCFIVFMIGCNNKKEAMKPTQMSMHPLYGYRLIKSSEDIKSDLKEKSVDTINFQSGDTIADIGAGDGRIEAMLSILHDSLTFYLQDIDSLVCNQDTLKEAISYFQKITNKPITNNFYHIIGSDDKTNLPNNKFDKILMLWTYQYFKNPKAIMTDLKLKMKPDGLMYIINPDPDIKIELSKYLTSEYGWNQSRIERQITDIISCGFELIQISRNYESSEKPYIMVFKRRT